MSAPSRPRLVSLKGDAAFRRLRRARSYKGRYLTLRYRPIAEPEVRVGIVVSKKVGKAVVRNKVKRRVREILRKTHLPPAEVMIIARPEAAEASFQDLFKDLYRLLRKSGLGG